MHLKLPHFSRLKEILLLTSEKRKPNCFRQYKGRPDISYIFREMRITKEFANPLHVLGQK